MARSVPDTIARARMVVVAATPLRPAAGELDSATRPDAVIRRSEVDGLPLGLEWAYVDGPVGSGKSTVLRGLVELATREGRRAIALQLQGDNSAGYGARGAVEVFDDAAFRDLVDALPRTAELPLLVVDGAQPADVAFLGSWVQQSGKGDRVQMICATNWVEVDLRPDWVDAAVRIRFDEPHTRGIATGCAWRGTDPTALSWALDLRVDPFAGRAQVTRGQ